MTVLSAAQSAGIRLLGRRPVSLFSDGDVFGLELGELANEAATDIAEYYDWQKLKLLQVHVGDGVTTAFDLPAGYGRMLKDGELYSLNWSNRPFRRARDETDWVYQQQVAGAISPGSWIILGGKMQIYPPMPVGEQASYYYISKNFIADEAGMVAAGGLGLNVLLDDGGLTLIDDQGNPLIGFGTFVSRSTFTDDSDVFVLSERLLTLSLIWRWRAQKRMEYSEDLTNYETALATAVGTDKGARILVTGTPRGRRIRGSEYVFPGHINP